MSDFIFSGNLRCTRDLYIGPNQTVPAFAINELGDVQLGGLRGMRIPHGTSAQRPFTDGTPNREGYIRYNTDTGKFEAYGGTSNNPNNSVPEWGDVGGVAGGDFQVVDGGNKETRVKVDNSLDRYGGLGISFYTSCRSQLIVDSTGNVGIGIRGLGDTTTTPCCALHVGGTSAVKLPVGNTAQRPYATSTAAHAGFIRYNNQTSQFEGFGAGDSWGSLGGVMDVDQDTFVKAESSANADNDELWFVTNGHRRMTIASDGNISIDSNMQINGNMDVFTISKVVNQVPNDITLNGTVEVGFGADAPDTLDNGLYLWNTGTGTGSVGRVGSNEIALNTGSGTNSGTERVRIDGNGNVGIGTTTPGSKLDINGVLKITSEGQQIILDGNHAYIRYRRDNTNPVTDIGWIGFPTSDTNDVNYNNLGINNSIGNIVLLPSNNVGIGTSNPEYKLEVNGDIKLGVGGNAGGAGGKIIFKGTYGDTGDGECVIENRIYGSGSNNEQSELLLFKANDTSGGSGPDRIRLRAANIVLDTYSSTTSDGSVSDTKNDRETVSSNATFIDQEGNVGIRTKLADDLPNNIAPEAPLHIIPRTTNYANGNGIYVQQLNENYNAVCTLRVSNSNDLDENGNFRGTCTSSATGDPMVSFDIHGQVGFSMGIDNTDNYFKIAQNWQQLESSTRLVIRNDGTLDVKETGSGGTYGGRIHYIGTSALGSVGHSNVWCGLKHRSLVANSESNYAILQANNGNTIINATNNVSFRINNGNPGVAYYNASQFHIAKELNINSKLRIRDSGEVNIYRSGWVKPFYPQKYRFYGKIQGSTVTLPVPSAIGGSNAKNDWVPNLVGWSFSSFDVHESANIDSGVLLIKDGDWKIRINVHEQNYHDKYLYFTILWIHKHFCDTTAYGSANFSSYGSNQSKQTVVFIS